MALRAGPSGEGRAARRRAVLSALAYSTGCIVGGATLGVAAASVARLVGFPTVWLAAAAGAAIAVLVGELTHRRLVFAERRWQVPQAWFTRYGAWAMIPAGFTLTLGVFTPVWFATFYVLVLLLAAIGPQAALGVGVVYGGARSIEHWRNALGPRTLGLHDVAALRRRHRVARPMILAALAAAAVTALAQAWS